MDLKDVQHAGSLLALNGAAFVSATGGAPEPARNVAGFVMWGALLFFVVWIAILLFDQGRCRELRSRAVRSGRDRPWRRFVFRALAGSFFFFAAAAGDYVTAGAGLLSVFLTVEAIKGNPALTGDARNAATEAEAQR